MKAIIKSISLMAVMVVLMAITACDSNNMSTNPVSPEQNEGMAYQNESYATMGHVVGNTPKEYPVFSVNNQVLGYIMVANDLENIYVTFGSLDGWVFAETELHLYDISAVLSVPETGIPMNEIYMINEQHRSYVSEYKYQIPLADTGLNIGDRIGIRARSEMMKYDPLSGAYNSSETLGENSANDDNMLSMYIQYTLRRPFNGRDGSVIKPVADNYLPL